MNRFLKATSTLALSAALAGFAGSASAATLMALTGDATITPIDSAKLTAGTPITVKGAPGPLAGIDVRPADGMLYGVTNDGTVVTIDTKTGAATVKVKLVTYLKPGVSAVIDFNPAADRLRVMGTDGTNLRANVDDGKVIVDGSLKYSDADAAKGKTSRVTAGAYTNSFKGTKETALYNIDLAAGTFVKQAPPNDGVLGTVGSLGVEPKTVALDIESDGKGGNTAWLMADDTLHRVDLMTGKPTTVGTVKGVTGPVRDIAVLPAM